MHVPGYNEVVVADFEFSQSPGERPRPSCLVAREIGSGRTHRICGDDLLSRRHPPYPIDRDTLFVAFFAVAEMACHKALGWQLPENILDIYVEFRNATNGLYLPNGRGLLGASLYYGLPAMDAAEKDEMRQLAIRGAQTAEEFQALLKYCEEDVDATERLLYAMAPTIDFCRATEHAGVPVDVPALRILQERWEDVQDHLIQQVDADFGVYDGRTFKYKWFEQLLIARDIPWSRLPTGALQLDDDEFKDAALTYPWLTPLRNLRKTLSQMRGFNPSIGSDGRNRYGLWPFSSRTGRNQPRNSESVLAQSPWFRCLIRPQPGYGLVSIDWKQQEFGIAAAYSGDPAMWAAYQSKDPYLAFAIQAGAVPPGATKATHGAIRELYKTCALGTLYNMGAATLARRTGLYIPYAVDLLKKHHKTYPKFWEWSDRVLDYGLIHNHLYTTFGWNLFLEDEASPASLRNYAMQANGAEMLRLACCLAIERGVTVVAPFHDSLLVEATVRDLMEATFTTIRAMRDASSIILDGFELKTDVTQIYYPGYYADPRGTKMRQQVWRIIRELEGKA